MRPTIVRIENRTDAYSFDVVIHSDNCSDAALWASGIFGRLQYLHSDFEGNHTYRRRRQGAAETLPAALPCICGADTFSTCACGIFNDIAE